MEDAAPDVAVERVHIEGHTPDEGRYTGDSSTHSTTQCGHCERLEQEVRRLKIEVEGYKKALAAAATAGAASTVTVVVPESSDHDAGTMPESGDKVEGNEDLQQDQAAPGLLTPQTQHTQQQQGLLLSPLQQMKIASPHLFRGSPDFSADPDLLVQDDDEVEKDKEKEKLKDDAGAQDDEDEVEEAHHQAQAEEEKEKKRRNDEHQSPQQQQQQQHMMRLTESKSPLAQLMVKSPCLFQGCEDFGNDDDGGDDDGGPDEILMTKERGAEEDAEEQKEEDMEEKQQHDHYYQALERERRRHRIMEAEVADWREHLRGGKAFRSEVMSQLTLLRRHVAQALDDIQSI